MQAAEQAGPGLQKSGLKFEVSTRSHVGFIGLIETINSKPRSVSKVLRLVRMLQSKFKSNFHRPAEGLQGRGAE